MVNVDGRGSDKGSPWDLLRTGSERRCQLQLIAVAALGEESAPPADLVVEIGTALSWASTIGAPIANPPLVGPVQRCSELAIAAT